jgi:hypothetical protein
MNWQEANAEDELRGKWQNRLVAHGESICPDCGHSGWGHSPSGCCVYVDVPTVPWKNSFGVLEGVVIDPSLSQAQLDTYKCTCHNNQLCKDNAAICGIQERPVYNEPLDRSYYADKYDPEEEKRREEYESRRVPFNG